MNETLKKMIAESIEDEKSDIDKYHRMAEMARTEGNEHIAGVLEDISHEERTHHKLLQEME